MFEVLDLNVKDLYCRHRWEPEQYEAGMKRLEEVVSLDAFTPALNRYLIIFSLMNITGHLSLLPHLILPQELLQEISMVRSGESAQSFKCSELTLPKQLLLITMAALTFLRLFSHSSKKKRQLIHLETS